MDVNAEGVQQTARWSVEAFIVILTMILTASAGWGQQDAAAERSIPEPPPNWRAGTHPLGVVLKSGTAYRTLNTPPVLGTQELETYTDLLVLSEAQHAAVMALHEKYIEEDWAYRVEVIAPIWERAARIYRRNYHSEVEKAETAASMYEEHARAVARLLTIEEQFFAEIEAILSDQQLLAMQRVRLRRERARTRMSFAPFPGAMFDIVFALAALERQEFDVEPKDPERFDDLLLEYEYELTPLFKLRVASHEALRTRADMLFAERQDIARPALRDAIVRAEEKADVPVTQMTFEEVLAYWDPAARAEVEELRRKERRLTRRNTRIVRRIHDLNARFVDLLAAELRPETGDELIRAFREQAYPRVFPDPFDLGPVLAAAEEIEPLSSDQRSDVIALAIMYDAEHGLISDQMIERLLEWKTDIGEQAGHNQDMVDAYTSDMQGLQEQRREHSLRTLETLQDIVGMESMALLEDAIAEFERGIAKFDERVEKLRDRGREWPHY
jgi:hypothetical protein